MSELKLDLQAIETIALFERFTRVPATDYIETGRAVYFVVPAGSMRKLKDNRGLERLSQKMGKTVRMVEIRDQPEAFLKSLFWQYGVEEATVEETPDGLVGRVRVSPLRKGRAIGKGGENLKALRVLAKRHAGIVSIHLE
ncbi:MAG: NusA-like transcription termination signal-binding factor [Thermoplasmata archaeon]|nr:NusA-like transcription termination signal-binding factor [Thermoplasmata archaeon]NIS14220.1 NusA-like transcription termination signal-binding factor [Thermoplasmata archaeon]NIS22055.1 NusA-like transcription termination signal-binding factor [Thermoplasmata archaeon]NIT79926.1 NusA-like transcription termination signal-binding factor [Thermoplasmata archaeon]NIU51076.1 NusA-like transcription termination signal-binding factor [Thermoplasmata archaeon]